MPPIAAFSSSAESVALSPGLVLLILLAIVGLVLGLRRLLGLQRNPRPSVLGDTAAAADRDAFIDQVERELRARFQPVSCSRIDEMGFDLTLADDATFQIHLDNLWRRCCTLDAGDRAPCIREFLDAMEEAIRHADSDDQPTNPDDIMPVVKDQAFFDQIRASMADGAGDDADAADRRPICEPLAGDLLVFYVIDRAASMRYLMHGDLEGLGLQVADLRALAVENMRRKLSGKVDSQGDGALRLLVVDGTFEGSLLLGDWIWQRLSRQLPGNPVVCLPARDVLLVTGSDSPQGLEALREAARDVEAVSPYPVSQTLLEWVDGHWEVCRR